MVAILARHYQQAGKSLGFKKAAMHDDSVLRGGGGEAQARRKLAFSTHNACGEKKLNVKLDSNLLNEDEKPCSHKNIQMEVA